MMLKKKVKRINDEKFLPFKSRMLTEKLSPMPDTIIFLLNCFFCFKSKFPLFATLIKETKANIEYAEKIKNKVGVAIRMKTAIDLILHPNNIHGSQQRPYTQFSHKYN